MTDKINPTLLEDSTDPPERRAPELRALGAIMDEDGDGARKIVRSMSRQSRAVLQFWITELSNVIDDVQMSDRI